MEWSDITSKQLLSLNNKNDKTEFLSEFYNIVSLSAFRRLQDKAQVFPLKTGDFIRTRLTHSIEVMSTAEEIGEKVSNRLKDFEITSFIKELSSLKDENKRTLLAQKFSTNNRMYESIPQILKSASILHDMGNPPFGHIGEDIISDWFKRNLDLYYFDKSRRTLGPILKQSEISEKEFKTKKISKLSSILDLNQRLDLENFEGNAQLLRILLKLNGFSREYSIALLGACMKYTCSSSNRPSASKRHKIWEKKIGYFISEEKYVAKLYESLGSKGARSPLAFLLEAADDISYLLSDIEDAIKKNIFSYDDIYYKLKRISSNSTSAKVKEAFGIIKDLHKKSIPVPFQITNFKKVYRSYLIDDVACTFISKRSSILKGNFPNALLSSGGFAETIDCFSNILKNKVYHSRIIAVEKTRVHKILNTLLDAIVPAAFYVEKTSSNKGEGKGQMICELISQNYKEECKKELKRIRSSNMSQSDKTKEMVYAVLRLAVDEISGMTDLYALHMYEIINAS